jgi:hypothetical protein
MSKKHALSSDDARFYGIICRMAQDPTDPVDKFLAEEKTREAQRHELIKEGLRQKEAAIKAYDDKLAKLGYDPEHPKRSHYAKHNDGAGHAVTENRHHDFLLRHHDVTWKTRGYRGENL